ncbi:MAG: hypothetical protein AMXMBFR47_41360 [Planctomycetota bacterium]
MTNQRARKTGDSKVAFQIEFTATLHRPAGREKSAGWTFLNLPKAASKKLPSRAQVAVAGTLNHHPFTATLEPDGQGGHWLKINQALREEVGAAVVEPVLVGEFSLASRLRGDAP